MLRASLHETGHELHARVIKEGCGTCGVPAGNDIRALVDACVLRDVNEYPDARVRTELRLGRDTADRIVMVAANFEMMNRLLDAIGVPVAAATTGLAAEMGLVIPEHLRP